MTYLGQENDFVKSQYSLTLFKAFFRHSLGALSACNAFFEFLCYNFTCQKFYTFTCCLKKTSLNCPECTKYVPFYSHCMHVEAIMLIFDQKLARSTDIKLKNIFVFHPCFVLDQLGNDYKSSDKTFIMHLNQDAVTSNFYSLSIHLFYGKLSKKLDSQS